MNRTDARDARRREQTADRLERDLEACQRAAHLAEVFTEGVNSPFWRLLDEEIGKRRVSFERGAVGMPSAAFEAEQGIVRGQLALKSFVEKYVGKKDHYLKKALEIAGQLDEGVKSGQIAPRG